MYFSHQDWVDILRNIFIFIFVFYGNEFMLRGFQRFRKPTVMDWNWNDISKFPFPELIEDTSKQFMISDGVQVETVSKETIKYSQSGEVIMSQSNLTPVTHWQQIPAPPKKF